MTAALYTAIGAAVLAVLLAVRVRNVRKVRFARRDALLAKYAHLKDDLSKMTYHEAEDIGKDSAFYDMPFTITVALSFALFKTYAIPTIAAVLSKSGQLGRPENAGRRAEDTAVLISEMSGGGGFYDAAGIDMERGSIALARMNWLHSRYGNLITRDDKLFTLALFVFEPFYFCEKFDFRPLTELEKEARYIHWREIGARMGIDNIPDTREKLLAWTTAYGKKHMVYDPRNGKVGDATFAVLLKDAPRFMWPLGKQVGMVLLDDQMLEAFGWQKPPAWLYWLVPRLLELKALACGYLLYPRTTPPPHVTTSVGCAFAGTFDESEAEKSDKLAPDAGQSFIVRDGYIFDPYYVRPDGPRMGALGFGHPGKPEFSPKGYLPSRLGPEKLYHQGVEETIKNAAEMRAKAQGGKCPFFVAKQQAAA